MYKFPFRSLLIALVAIALPCPLAAQTLLRWKLKPGESLAVEMEQETQSHVAFGGKSATTKIELNLRLRWTVAAADEKEITFKQSIQRIQIKLTTPQGAPVEYDS